MGTKEAIINIATLGASGRIDKVRDEYEKTYSLYEALLIKCSAKEIELNQSLEQLCNQKIEVQTAVKKLEKIDIAHVKERIDSLETVTYNNDDMAYITDSINATDAVLASVSGLVGGVATVAGSWALMGAIGTASTGTFISTLGGVAATKATLAAFGGGSLAVGGFGMAGGRLVLGTIAVVPALLITGVLQHLSANKKIEKIRDEECKLTIAMGEIDQYMIYMGGCQKRSEELIKAIKVELNAFHHLLKATIKLLKPSWFLAGWIRWYKIKVNEKLREKEMAPRYKGIYKQYQLNKINALLAVAKQLLVVRDTPIIEKMEES